MPSELKGLLDRTVHLQAGDVFEQMAKAVEQTANLHCHVIDWLNTPSPVSGTSTVQAMLRHTAAQLDGISVLIKFGVTEPIVPLVRTVLEEYVQIEYMLDDLDIRSKCFRVAALRARLLTATTLDPRTSCGASFSASAAGDIKTALPVVSTDMFDAEVKAVNDALATSALKPIDDEWLRTKGNRKSAPKWYALFGGPSSFHKLLERSGKKWMYPLFYSPWSAVSHGEHAQVFMQMADGGTALRPIRFPDNGEHLCGLAISFALRTSDAVIRAMLPDRIVESTSMYVSDIRAEYLRMTSAKRIKVN